MLGTALCHAVVGVVKSEGFGEQRSLASRAEMVEALCEAVSDMSRTRTGALIVMERSTKLGDVIRSGVELDAKVTAYLIRNVFYNKAPLHDGAMIIGNKVIKAAGCILPLSHNMNVPKSFGLRHRAALGVSERLDVQAIIVSEETGKISYAENGTIIHDISTKELESILSKSKA